MNEYLSYHGSARLLLGPGLISFMYTDSEYFTEKEPLFNQF